jgi:DNA-binding IclR family transcriptional regulator
MQAIDKILGILHNGDWHGVTEVARRTDTQESKIELISSFLDAYDFLEYDKKTKRIKLSKELQDFFVKIEEIEQREAAGKSNRSSKA